MKRTEIIKENLKNFGMYLGEPIKGKGTEVFSKQPSVASFTTHWGDIDKNRKEFLEAVSKHDINDLYVYSIRNNEQISSEDFDSEDFMVSLTKHDLQMIIDSNIKDIKNAAPIPRSQAF